MCRRGRVDASVPAMGRVDGGGEQVRERREEEQNARRERDCRRRRAIVELQAALKCAAPAGPARS